MATGILPREFAIHGESNDGVLFLITSIYYTTGTTIFHAYSILRPTAFIYHI